MKTTTTISAFVATSIPSVGMFGVLAVRMEQLWVVQEAQSVSSFS